MAPQQQPDQTAHVNALQSVLASLGVLTVQQLVSLFSSSATEGFTGLLHAAVPDIVAQHAQAAATVTAQWYDELAPDLPFQATPVVDLPPERIKKSVDWALRAPTKTLQPGGTALQDAPPDPATSLTRLSGSAKRMVYDASRDTVVQNAAQEGVGWARHAQPDACAFCRILATRSGKNLYMSEHSAQFVVGRGGKARGSRKLGDKYHDHCRCIAVPVRAGKVYIPPAATAQWQQDYEDARTAVGGNLKAILAHMRANTNAA